MKAKNTNKCLKNHRDTGALANKTNRHKANIEAVTKISVAAIGLKEEKNCNFQQKCVSFFQNFLVIKVCGNKIITDKMICGIVLGE